MHLDRRLRAAVVLVIVLVATSAAAQPCRDLVAPAPVVGQPQGLLWLAPASNAYPVQIAYPPGATRFSIVTWTSTIPTHVQQEVGGPFVLVPEGSVQMREYIERPPFGSGQSFLTIGMVTTSGERFFGRSHPVLPNTAYTVWVGNTNAFWVPVYLIIHYQLCGV